MEEACRWKLRWESKVTQRSFKAVEEGSVPAILWGMDS